MFLHRPQFQPVRDEEGRVRVASDSGQALFHLCGEMRFVHVTGEEWVVSPHFIGDGGSVPSPLRWLIHPHDERAKHAFHLHDFHYSGGSVSRLMADRVLFYSLRASGISLPVACLTWLAVRLFGAAHFNR